MERGSALATQVERIVEACGLGRGSLDLVAHCTGGLADSRIRRAVGVAGPVARLARRLAGRVRRKRPDTD